MTLLLVNAAWPADVEPDLAGIASVIRAAGGDGLTLPDSPRLFADPLIGTDRLLETEVDRAGPCVIALGLRHPATVAASLRALAQRHGSRLVAVLARGESAVRNEGLPVPRLAEYLAMVDAVVDGVGERHGMTLLGSASGPRTLAATAARLDGILIDVGCAPSTVAAAAEQVRAANPQSQVWLFLRVLASDDEAERAAAVRTLLGSCAARMAASPDWYQVPERLRDKVVALAAAQDHARHGTSDALTGSLDAKAVDAVSERFFIVGAGESVQARIAALAPVGLDGVVLSGAVGGLVPHLAETVAAVRAGLDQTSPKESR